MNWLLKLFGKDKTFGATRSGSWRRFRKQFLKEHPCCEVCGKTRKLLKPLEVHHCIPVWKDISLELSENNLITLCRDDHFTFGHLKSWHSFNPKVVEDARIWLGKIKNR